MNLRHLFLIAAFCFAAGALPSFAAGKEKNRKPGNDEKSAESRESTEVNHIPAFRVFFDFLLTQRASLSPSITFDSYHQVLGVEFNPLPGTKLIAEVSTEPRYFQIEQDITSRLSVKMGRIWIPFDELTPHSIYGGRINIQKLVHPGGQPILPDVFTDLGVAAKYHFSFTEKLAADAYFYVVNGFQDLGRDPKDPNVGSYPNFGEIALEDNNDDKALGARVHATYSNWLGLGVSGYRGRYSNRDSSNESLYILGVDAQLMLWGTEFRAGYMYSKVSLPAPATKGFIKGGLYGEWGIPFGAWKILARGGQAQADSRLPDVMDQTIVGASILYRTGPVQLSLQYDKDFHTNGVKRNYEFIAARVSFAAQ